jgi:polysaccharide biosynthesis protein PslG
VSGGSHSNGQNAKPTPTPRPRRHPKARVTPLPTVTSTPTAPPIAPHFAGSPRNLGDLFGLGSYVAQRTSGLQVQALNDARSTGVTWLREEFTANQIHSQTSGPYQWARYDRAVQRERRLGFHILGLLDYSNTFTWANHAYMPHSDIRSLAHDFAEYAYVMAKHYRSSIETWQVWNEPDLHLFWRPYPNASDYAIVLNQAYDAIKRANPKAQVVLGGPSGADPNAVRFVQRVVQAGGRFDILAMQPYQPTPGPQLLNEVQSLRAYSKPIWFTELGWAGETSCQSICGSEQSQGDRLARLYVAAAYSGVDRLFWYDLRDDGRRAYFEDHFGLLENNLAKKPSFWAYKLSLFLLDGGKLLGVARLRPQVLALEVRNHGKRFDIVWNDDLTSYKLNMAWTGPPAAVLNWRGQQVGSSSHAAVRMNMAQRSLLYIVPRHFSPVQ